MKRRARYFLIALLVEIVVANVIGFIAGLTRSPELGDLAFRIGLIAGCFTFFIYLPLRAGNRRVAKADAGARSEALAFSCAPDRSLLYIARTGFLGKAMGVNILVDGKTVTQLRTPRFAVVELAPGQHQLSAQIGNGDSAWSGAGGQFSTSLAAGSVTALHLAMKLGKFRSRWTFEPWSLDIAKSKLRSIEMVQIEMPAA